MEPAPARPRHEAIDHDGRLAHKWRLAPHTALGIPSPLAQATAGRVDLLAVHAARPGGPTAAGRAALAAQRQLTVSLAGTYHQLADADIPAALLAFARAENATQLVLGATRRTWLAALRPTTTIRSHLIRRGGGIGVHIVPCPLTANGVPRRRVLRIRALIRGEEQ